MEPYPNPSGSSFSGVPHTACKKMLSYTEGADSKPQAKGYSLWPWCCRIVFWVRRREGSDHPCSPVLVSDLYIPSLIPPEQLSAKVNGKHVVLLLSVTFNHLHQGFPQSVGRFIVGDVSQQVWLTLSHFTLALSSALRVSYCSWMFVFSDRASFFSLSRVLILLCNSVTWGRENTGFYQTQEEI